MFQSRLVWFDLYQILHVVRKVLKWKLGYLMELGLDATKPVFRVSDKVRFKPACSAT